MHLQASAEGPHSVSLLSAFENTLCFGFPSRHTCIHLKLICVDVLSNFLLSPEYVNILE